MRLVTYDGPKGPAPAVLLQQQELLVPAGELVQLLPGDPTRGASVPTTVRQILASGISLIDLAAAATAVAAEQGIPLQRVVLGPPVPDPAKILCVGLNYRDHADEAGLALPTLPMVFAKFANSLAGPRADIMLPAASEAVDYEGELAVVIGRRCKAVSRDNALGYVAGAMVLNDVTARDLQGATSQWTVGKAVDTFAPCGPALVTLDEVGPLDGLTLRTEVNDQVVQDSHTGNLIFDVPALIEHLSRTMTLEPGDIIATGTPAGVGFKRQPQLLLHDGDTVTVTIGTLGTITNVCRAEPAPKAAALVAATA